MFSSKQDLTFPKEFENDKVCKIFFECVIYILKK